MLVQWPGEIADGDGREQFIIDERADTAQRGALEKILRGESTAPGATHFYVFNSTMSKVLETVFAPIDLEIDVKGRTARVEIPEIGTSRAQPIIDPNSGEEFQASFGLPNGFQLTEAEIGNGTTDLRAAIELHLSDSPAHFIAEQWRPGAIGALCVGLVHGAYCLGCCGVLMGLLFFGGVMNLLWIAAITLVVLFEKIAPFGASGDAGPGSAGS